MLNRFKLTTRINIIVGAVMLLIIAVMGYWDNRYSVESTITEHIMGARRITDNVAAGLDVHMRARNLKAIQSEIEDIRRRQPGLVRLRLISSRGAITASTDEKEVNKDIQPTGHTCMACHDTDPPRHDIPPGRIGSVLDMASGRRVIRVVTPINNRPGCASGLCHNKPEEMRVLGMVEADFDYAPLAAGIQRRKAHTAVFAVVLFVSVTGLISIFIWLFTGRPLKRLMGAMRRISKGSFDERIPVSGSDEIAELAREFNAMAAGIEEKETSLRQTRDYLLGIVENSADIIITLSPNDTVETFNRGAERILGFPRREIIGWDWKSLFFDEREHALFLEEIEKKKRLEGFEARLRHKNGDSIHVMLTESRLWGTSGNIIGKILIGVDITEYRAVQQRLIQHERLAAIGTAITQILHGTKNILNNFQGGAYMVNTALKKDNPQMLREGWDIVQRGIERITELTRDMLDFSRARSLDLKPGSINALAQEVIWSVRETAKKHSVRIFSELDPDLPTVVFDAKAMHTALMNVVSNAIDACRWHDYPAGVEGEVRVRTRADESAGNAFIEVRDNGTGIPRDKLDKIFIPFYSTKFSDGNGLGLSITKKTVREHGGGIKVDTEPGSGSAFIITLPLKPVRTGGDAPSQQTQNQSPESNLIT